MPTEIRARRAGIDDTGEIPFSVPHTSNMFTWTPDPQNTTGRIAIHYILGSQPQTGPGSSTVGEDVLIVPDNGSFNMDPLIPANAASLRIEFIRGTSSSLVTEGKKVLFSIYSNDFHKYVFAD